MFRVCPYIILLLEIDLTSKMLHYCLSFNICVNNSLFPFFFKIYDGHAQCGSNTKVNGLCVSSVFAIL